MYGQMTAGSWIYIGTQGILQGTYETFAEAARQHFGGSLKGRLVADRRPRRHGRRPAARRHDERRRDDRRRGGPPPHRAAPRDRATSTSMAETSTRRSRAREAAAGEEPALSIGLLGNAADVLPELVRARRRARPRHRPDERPRPAERLRPEPHELRRRRSRCARADPARAMAEARRSMGEHVRAMLDLKARGSVVFDYGNNIRAEALKAGVANAFDFPGFVPAYIRPLFCEGKGPFRWACLSGDPDDLAATDEAVLETFPRGRGPRPLDPPRARAREAAGPARAHLLARLRRAREDGPRLQRARAQRPREGADRHRPRPPRRGLGGLAEPRDRGHARRLRRGGRLADPQRAAQRRVRAPRGSPSTTAAASAWATRSTPAWWWWRTARAEAAARLERVLTTDPGTGVMRHADAGYERARDVARERGVKIPMLS